MLSLVLSTVAFFVSSHFLKRYLEESGIPKGATRGALVFTLALAVSYIVAMAADRVFH